MFLDRGDVLLHTVSFGPDRDPVIALNGWSAAWQAWEPTFAVLSADRRCISYDTRGTSGSPCAPEAITLDALVSDVFAVLDAYGIDRCTLAGESLGGFVALTAAIADPPRFTDVVLVASTPVVGPEQSGSLAAGARRDYAATITRFVELCLSEPASAVLHPWGRTLFRGGDPECAARLLECCYGRSVDLGAVRVPVTVVQGDADLIVPVDVGRSLAAAIPGSTYVELAGAGHAPTITRPGDVALSFAAR